LHKGIAKILNALEYYSSPPPEFKTDPGRHYMITMTRMREGFEAVNEVINEAISEVADINLSLENTRTPALFETIGRDKNQVYRFASVCFTLEDTTFVT